MKSRETINQPTRGGVRARLLVVSLLVLHGCSGPTHLHKIRITGESVQDEQQEFVRSISRPVIDLLSENGFRCRSDYGHSLFYAACTHKDASGIGQTTDTFINILYPDSQREVELTITTSQLTYHPFTGSNRQYFVQWRDLVLSAIDSLPDVSYSDYEVE